MFLVAIAAGNLQRLVNEGEIEQVCPKLKDVIPGTTIISDRVSTFQVPGSGKLSKFAEGPHTKLGVEICGTIASSYT